MPTSVRVVSWNVLHGRDYERGVVDLDACAAAVGSLGADVVALQEVDRYQDRSDGVDQVKELAARTGMHGVFAPALYGSPEDQWEPFVKPDHGGRGYGIGMLSRYPIMGHVIERLPGGGDPEHAAQPRARKSSSRPGWDHEPRIALSVTMDLGEHRLRVTNVHLSYLPWRGATQAMAAAALARRGRGPSVLLGDFNLPRWAVRFGAMEFRHTGGAPTFPADAPKLQLDHLLVRGVPKARARVGPRLTSDHLPLIADLTLR